MNDGHPCLFCKRVDINCWTTLYMYLLVGFEKEGKSFGRVECLVTNRTVWRYVTGSVCNEITKFKHIGSYFKCRFIYMFYPQVMTWSRRAPPSNSMPIWSNKCIASRSLRSMTCYEIPTDPRGPITDPRPGTCGFIFEFLLTTLCWKRLIKYAFQALIQVVRQCCRPTVGYMLTELIRCL